MLSFSERSLLIIPDAFLAGLFIPAGEGKFSMNLHMKLFLTVGFCGVFTAFSAFIERLPSLLERGRLFRLSRMWP